MRTVFKRCLSSKASQLTRRFFCFVGFFDAVEEVILAEERTTDEERRHIIEGKELMHQMTSALFIYFVQSYILS